MPPPELMKRLQIPPPFYGERVAYWKTLVVRLPRFPPDHAVAVLPTAEQGQCHYRMSEAA
jgi:hypothetical protein